MYRHTDLLVFQPFGSPAVWGSFVADDTLAGSGTEDVVVVVPPRRSAVPKKNAEGAWLQRNSQLERIEEIGRRA